MNSIGVALFVWGCASWKSHLGRRIDIGVGQDTISRASACASGGSGVAPMGRGRQAVSNPCAERRSSRTGSGAALLAAPNPVVRMEAARGGFPRDGA